MKKLIYLIISLSIPAISIAQEIHHLNQEKLLDFYQTQHYAEAAKYLDTVYNAETGDSRELAQLAYTNLMAGNMPQAEKYYLKLYEQQPQSLSVLFNLAGISLRRGDNLKAKSYYLKIIEIDSLNFNVYKQLAAIISSPTDPEKISFLKKANSLQPNNAEIAFDLANSLNLTKQNYPAYIVIQKALSADSLNIILLKAKMPVCIALLKPDETIQTGNQLLALGDSSTYVLNNLGKAYFITKNYERSLLMFKEIEKLNQQNESTLYYTALCYREIKDYPNAIKSMKEAVNQGISPNISMYYKVLGGIYESNSMIENANLSYHKSLDFDNDGSVFYNLALINDFKLKNKNAALKYYRKYLNTEHDQIKLKDVIEYVEQRIEALKRHKL